MVGVSANEQNRQKDTKGYEDDDDESDETVSTDRRRILSCEFGNIYRGMQQLPYSNLTSTLKVSLSAFCYDI